MNNIRITTERATSQPDKILLFLTDAKFSFYGEILSSELNSSYAKINKIWNILNNVLFKNFESYNNFDVLRIEGLHQGPGPHEVALIFNFVAFKNNISLLLLWPASENWLVWRMWSPLRSRREDKCLHMFLVSGW